MTALAVVTVLALPVAVLVGLLRLVDAVERRRAAVVARQIRLTDAIHAELGPIVAPLVRRGRHGHWVATLAVAPGHPHVGRVIQIAQATLGVETDILLTAPAPPSRREHRRPAPTFALSGARSGR